MNSAPRKLRLAARAALRVEAFAQELDVGHAGNFDRILEAEEQARGGALVRLQREQILPVERHRALGHLIARPPAEHIGQRRLARAVRPHDRMHLARGHAERQAVEDRLVGDRRVEVFNLEHRLSRPVHADRPSRCAERFAAQIRSMPVAESDACRGVQSARQSTIAIDGHARRHHPTLPSRLIPSSFCASTANSIGSCFSTSRAKPLTISATAASCVEPALIA